MLEAILINYDPPAIIRPIREMEPLEDCGCGAEEVSSQPPSTKPNLKVVPKDPPEDYWSEENFKGGHNID